MIMDNLLLFDGSVSAAGALSGTSTSAWSVGNRDSANIIDLSQIANSASGAGRDIGIGDDPLWLLIINPTAITGAASSTLTVNLLTAPDNGSGSPGAWTTLLTSQAYAVGTSGLAVGTELLRVALPLGIQKFLKLNYVTGTANITAGSIVAAIVDDRTALGPLMGYPNNYSTQYI